MWRKIRSPEGGHGGSVNSNAHTKASGWNGTLYNSKQRTIWSHALFLKGQWHRGIFYLGTIWEYCQILLENFKGTNAMDRGIEAIALVASVNNLLLHVVIQLIIRCVINYQIHKKGRIPNSSRCCAQERTGSVWYSPLQSHPHLGSIPNSSRCCAQDQTGSVWYSPLQSRLRLGCCVPCSLPLQADPLEWLSSVPSRQPCWAQGLFQYPHETPNLQWKKYIYIVVYKKNYTPHFVTFLA